MKKKKKKGSEKKTQNLHNIILLLKRKENSCNYSYVSRDQVPEKRSVELPFLQKIVRRHNSGGKKNILFMKNYFDIATKDLLKLTF